MPKSIRDPKDAVLFEKSLVGRPASIPAVLYSTVNARRTLVPSWPPAIETSTTLAPGTFEHSTDESHCGVIDSADGGTVPASTSVGFRPHRSQATAVPIRAAVDTRSTLSLIVISRTSCGRRRPHSSGRNRSGLRDPGLLARPWIVVNNLTRNKKRN